MRSYNPKDIANKTILYLEGINNIEDKNTPTVLTEAAQANVKKYQLGVMVPYHDGKLNPTIMDAVKTGEEIYLAEHPEKATKSNDLTRTAEMQIKYGENIEKEGRALTLVKKEESPFSLPKAGYINIAILLYGTLNIGIILAIAFMK